MHRNHKKHESLKQSLDRHNYVFIDTHNALNLLLVIILLFAFYSIFGCFIHDELDTDITCILLSSVSMLGMSIYGMYRNTKGLTRTMRLREIIRKVFFRHILVLNIIFAGSIALFKDSNLNKSLRVYKMFTTPTLLYLLFLIIISYFGSLIIYDMFIDDLKKYITNTNPLKIFKRYQK